MQYIGETLRYLCNTPKVRGNLISQQLRQSAAVLMVECLCPSCSWQKDDEKNHKVRIAIGNGVRTDVWSEFLHRFGDIKVRELYAATEGNIGFVNYTSKIGAVGRVNFVHRVGRGSKSEVFTEWCNVCFNIWSLHWLITFKLN